MREDIHEKIVLLLDKTSYFVLLVFYIVLSFNVINIIVVIFYYEVY